MISAKRRISKRAKKLPLLVNGDHLNQKTFHARYEAMPPDCSAELIGGIVYMMPRRNGVQGSLLTKLGAWLGEYEDATPGVEGLINVTNVMAADAEPQPDASLLILPEYGGQTWIDETGYLAGAPEWLGEISDSTESIDLNAKKLDYEKAGVREYMVAAVRIGQLFWFVRRRGKFKELQPDKNGVFRSEIFPGLWLDRDAFFKRNGKRLLAVLRHGLASPEHAAFVAKMPAKKA